MSKQLSNISEQATEQTNTTGVMDPILDIQPDRGRSIEIQGAVETGQAPGIPIFADLKDSNGNDLPLDTEVALQYKAPGDDEPHTVSDKLTNIRPFNTNSIQKQQDVRNIDSVKVELKNTDEMMSAGMVPAVEIRDVDHFYVAIKTSTAIDWSNSKLYIDRNAVTEY